MDSTPKKRAGVTCVGGFGIHCIEIALSEISPYVPPGADPSIYWQTTSCI